MGRTKIVLISVICFVLVVGPILDPVITGWVKGLGDGMDLDTRAAVIPGPYRNLKKLVDDLLAVTTDWTDSDEDGLPDAVERIIGTEYENADSDYDTLNDSYEVSLNIDPLKADSNDDGLVDPREVLDVPLDVDGDGAPNGWDRDNDNDGFEDGTDKSPSACTDLIDTFHLDLNTTGKPLYISMQLRPKNPEKMKLMLGTLDWPYDDKGVMKDLDNSTGDVLVSPILKLKGNVLPAQDEVVEYGMKVGEDGVKAPLSAEWEYGRVVGLGAKIFYPGSAEPMNLSLDMSIEWVVTGITDTEVRTIKANDQKYLTSMGSGSVKANSTERTEPQRFGWERIGEDKVSLRTAGGYYIGVDMDGKVRSGFETRDDQCIFTIKKETGYQYLTDENGNYLVLLDDGSIGTTKDRSEKARFVIENDGVRKNSITLMTYTDEFVIASLTISENYGTDIGLVYSEDAEEMIAANMVLTSSYMRNYSLKLDEIPEFLQARNITIRNSTGSYQHSDLAVKAALGTMVIEAFETLPEGELCSITTLMEDSASIADLTGISSLNGSSFSVDMSDVPIITTRLMKSTWYEPPSKEPLGPSEFLLRIDPLLDPLKDEDKKSMIGMVLFWNVGEIRVMKIGDDVKGNGTDEWMEEASRWSGAIVGSISFVINFVKDFVLPVLEFLTFMYKQFTTSSQFLIAIIKGTGASVLYILKSFKDWGAWGSSVAKVLFGVGIVISIIGYVIDVALLIFNLVAMYGAAACDPFQITLTTIYAVMAFSWITALFGVGLFFSILTFILSLQAIPVGGQIAGFIIGVVVAIVGLLYALEELVVSLITGKSGSEWVISWIIGLISGVWVLTSVDMDLFSSEISIDDVTGNGLDSNDRIEFKNIWDTTVTRDDKGTADQLKNSYIRPDYRISVPMNTSAGRVYFETGNYSKVISSQVTDNEKKVRYESGAWIKPGTGMVNYPVVVDLLMSYSRYYQEYLFWGLIPFDPKTDSSVSVLDTSTHYFDILPATIDEFNTWRYLIHADADGDGINNTDEVGTDPMRWDTDGDGLGDKYELDIGYVPNASDSDGDGLVDKRELFARIDPMDEDSDDDGLTDMEELEGWVINFSYCGKDFEWHIISNPGYSDTDGDGLNDTMEYLCLLNPMSYDTNGDGMDDELQDYTTTEIEHVETIGDDDGYALKSCYGVTVLEDGGLIMIGTKDFKDDTLVKIGPEGAIVWNYTDPYSPFDGFVDVDCGPDGRIYASNYYNYDPTDSIGVWVLNPNGTYNSTLLFPDFVVGVPNAFWVKSLALDDEGNLYTLSTSDRGFEHIGYPIQAGVHLVKFYPNGTVADMYSFPSGSTNPFPGGIESFPDGNWRGTLDIDSKGNMFITDPSRDRVLIFDREYNLQLVWDMTQFGEVKDLQIDDDDNVYICGYDGSHDLMQKFDRYRRVIAEWSTDLYENSVCPDGSGFVYVGGDAATEPYRGRIMRFWENVTFHRVSENFTYTDTDGEGLTDVLEETGWNVTVSLKHASISYHINSSINLVDTDMDGLDDLEEFELGSDPRNIDSDMDSVPDPTEAQTGTNLTSWDTDGDGLGDGQEETFNSDPFRTDSDGEGLSDLLELMQGSDPTVNDTDSDGLSDLSEWELGWAPVSPDADGDFMFDGDELGLGCDPNDPDKDKDGIDDGYERLFMTDPRNGDSDSDDLLDGYEVDFRLDPNSNDTDKDGMTDPRELEVGYNPRKGDSDGDGTPDGSDMDYSIELDEDVVIAIDESLTSSQFLLDLSGHTGTKKVSPEDLLKDHKGSKYIVIVGRPSALDGTAGSIVRNLLIDSGDLLEKMAYSDENRCVVRYGVWSPQQTVILLSQPYPNDYNRVLGILKSMRMAIGDGTVLADFVSPCSLFDLSYLDSIRETDSSVAGSFRTNLTFRTEVSLLNDPAPLEILSNANALGPDEVSMEKYVRSNITNINGTKIDDRALKGVSLRVYYTLDDLDLTNDGDALDPEDLNETTLIMCGNHNGTWVQLSEADWISETGVDTTDLTVAGKDYAGYLWMKGDHLSTYGIAGKRNTPKTFVLSVGPIQGEDGIPIPGANVSLVFSRTEYKNATGIDGLTSFVLSEELLGNNVIVSIEKVGYEPVFYSTTITQEGRLGSSPPNLERIEAGEDDDENGTNVGLFLIIIAVLFLLLIVAIALLLRRRKDQIEE
ncbi:MAG: hypothetical protein MUC62_00670 [Candidatus Thermoplasmatota archaeon]|jgi:hypothetical protein|nr:hypothetical protein [Candidatus Thermoplasmatota archaeon]